MFEIIYHRNLNVTRNDLFVVNLVHKVLMQNYFLLDIVQIFTTHSYCPGNYKLGYSFLEGRNYGLCSAYELQLFLFYFQTNKQCTTN